jgi:hypothetical protein
MASASLSTRQRQMRVSIDQRHRQLDGRAEEMTPGTGTRLGPYEIVALLGAGGIGEVLLGEGTTAHVGIAALLPPCREG